MKIILIGTPEIVMQNPDSHYNYFGWPTATRLQNGKIAVVASGFRMSHLCPFGKMVISYSEDDGKTYTAPATVIDTPLDDRDGGILAYGKSGVIVTSFNHPRKPYYSWGTTWAEKKGATDFLDQHLKMITDEEEKKYLGVTFRMSNDCGVTFGPIMRSPVTSPHGPCKLKDGSILWVGSVHPHRGEKFINSYKLNPDGSFEFLGEIENIVENGERQHSSEPCAIQLDDGRILCHIRAQTLGKSSVSGNYFTIFQSISEDGGRSWSKPERVLTEKGGAPAHIIKHSSGALISTYGCRHSRYGIKAMISTDNGKTWDIDKEIYVNTVSTDLGYPSTVEMPDGSLLTVYYARPSVDSSAVVIMQQRWKLEM